MPAGRSPPSKGVRHAAPIFDIALTDLLYKGTLFAFFPSTNPLQFAQSIYKIAQLDKVSRILPGHHQLEISDKFLDKAKSSFEKLEKEDLLYQGSGLHDFGDLKIKL